MSSLSVSGDGVSAVLGFALDGLAARQRTVADNLANIDTPGFRSSYVDFESVLRSAVGSGGPSDDLPAVLAGEAPAVGPSDSPVGANGNNVDLRKETLSAMQSQFQYQLLTRAVTDRFELVRAVAGAV